jgi:hypothetical protein
MVKTENYIVDPKTGRGTLVAKKNKQSHKGDGRGESKYSDQSPKLDPAAERILNAAQWN